MRRRPSRRAGLAAAAAAAAAVAALALLAPARAGAQGPDEEGGLFLLLPVGARAVGGGQAVVADRPGSEAVWWNPSALARLDRREIALHHSQTIVYKGDAISVVVPSALLGTIALSFNLYDYDEVDDTPSDPTQPSTGKILPRNLVLAGSYAATLGSRLNAGVTYKLVQFRLDCVGSCTFPTEKASTSALDLGLQYDLVGLVPVSVGLAVRNVGIRFQVNDSDQADPLPTRLQFGAVYRLALPDDLLRGAEVSVLGDVVDEVNFRSPGANFGAEVGYRKRVRLRAGYAYEPAGGSSPSLGIGLEAGKLAVDIATTLSGFSADAGQPPTYLSLRYLF